MFEENCWLAATKSKFQAEAAIRASGVPYSIFKATWFMEALGNLVHGRRAFVFGNKPHPWHLVAGTDYARMVSKAYALPEAANKEFFIYGPEMYTIPQALQKYVDIVYPGVAITTMPFWFADLFAQLGRRRELQAVLPFLRYCEKVDEGGDPSEANQLLGAPATTLEDWCRSQVPRGTERTARGAAGEFLRVAGGDTQP